MPGDAPRSVAMPCGCSCGVGRGGIFGGGKLGMACVEVGGSGGGSGSGLEALELVPGDAPRSVASACGCSCGKGWGSEGEEVVCWAALGPAGGGTAWNWAGGAFFGVFFGSGPVRLVATACGCSCPAWVFFRAFVGGGTGSGWVEEPKTCVVDEGGSMGGVVLFGG